MHIRLNRLGFAALVAVSILLPSVQPIAAQSSTCASALAPQLTVGGFGRVTVRDANLFRDTAGKAVGKIPVGAIFNVLDGPKCMDGMNSWQVNYEDVQGWTAEADTANYWLVPYKPVFKVTTSKDTTHVDYEDFSFDIDSKLVQNLDYQFETAEWQTMSALPDHVCFGLYNPPDEAHYFNSLCVISMKTMEGYAASIKQILKDKPSFDAPENGVQIPTPFPGAAQVIQSKLHYIDTDEVQGVSFVTHYTQDWYIITGDMLTYNFSGLTRDGRYILFISYDVTTPLLPFGEALTEDDAAAQLQALYEDTPKYYKGIVATLNKGKSADFTPDLDPLDDIVKSMQFH